VTGALLAALLAAAPGPQWLGPPPPAEVTRVVTLAPSLTETVLALGAGARLVGVSRFEEDPAVAALPKVGGFNDVAVEAVVALKPQLVVVTMAPANRRPVETLGRLGVPVLALPLTTVEDVAQAMGELGRVLGRAERAAELVGALEGTRAQMRAEAKRRRHSPRVLFAYGFSPLVVAGPGSFAHQLLEDCGATNVALQAKTAYPTYPLERAVALAPDVVVDAADTAGGRDEVRALLPAPRTRWVTLGSTDLLHPGPTLARGLRALCALLADAPRAGDGDGDGGADHADLPKPPG
jgi:iron complex transport system substrate-binding protein